MEITDFAKYVIDNIDRASLVNSFNISKRLIEESDENLFLFFKVLNEYVEKLLMDKSMDKLKSYSILSLSYNTIEKLKSEFNYNKTVLIDSFIIDLWEIYHGSKNA